MATLTPHKRAKDTVWRASYYVEGKRFTPIIPVEDKKTAQKLADEQEAATRAASRNSQEGLTREYWEGQVDGIMIGLGFNPVFRSEHTVMRVAQEWFESRTAKKVTLDAYARHLRFIEGHSFGALPILSVSRTDCERLLGDFGENRAKGTVKVFRATLQGIFKHAMKYEIVARNVTNGIELKGDDEGGFERKMFSVEDVRTLRAFFADPSNVEKIPKGTYAMNLEEFQDWRIMMEMSLRGAVRIKDNSRLTSDDLKEKNGVLYLTYSAEKTGAEVQIPCSDLFKKLVEGREGLLCPTLSDKLTNGKKGLSARWILVQETAEVDRCVEVTSSGKRVSTKSFHSWRHTAPSWMAAAGIQDKDIRAVTGHTGEILNEVYMHQVEEEQANNKVKLDNWEASHGL